MASPSRILAWRIPRTGEPGGLQSMGSLSTSKPRVTRQSSFPLQNELVPPLPPLLFQTGRLLGSHHLTLKLHPGIWSTSVTAHLGPTFHLLQGLLLPGTTLFSINIKLSEMFHILFLHHVAEIHCVFQ